MKHKNDILPFLRRALLTGVEHLGIQRSATEILVILYLEKQKNNPALSIKEIVEKSNLSLSSVSVLCSRLEIEGILIRHSDDSSLGRGRRKILYEFAIGIDGLLALGTNKYIRDVGRICRDIKLYLKQNESDDNVHNELLSRLRNEICSFLEHSRVAIESTTSMFEKESQGEIDLKEKIVEGAI
ncbi:MAG: hypothetical protein ACFFE6_03330 [Candidatus Thorarchaeota archaeon]